MDEMPFPRFDQTSPLLLCYSSESSDRITVIYAGGGQDLHGCAVRMSREEAIALVGRPREFWVRVLAGDCVDELTGTWRPGSILDDCCVSDFWRQVALELLHDRGWDLGNSGLFPGGLV